MLSENGTITLINSVRSVKTMKKVTFSPLGDHAIIIDFGDGTSLEKNHFIHKYRQMIESSPFPGFIEAIPAYTTLTIFYNPTVVGTDFPYKTVKKRLQRFSFPANTSTNYIKKVEIPVCYEEPFALDLKIVSNHTQMPVEEVIKLHCDNIYHVHFLGFSPGFPFLGGMKKKLAIPRKSSPRLKVPRGSVGIAGDQTGVYPLASPGGWQIIGRTPLKLFDVDSAPITLISPGDQVQFIPISTEEFLSLEEEL